MALSERGQPPFSYRIVSSVVERGASSSSTPAIGSAAEVCGVLRWCTRRDAVDVAWERDAVYCRCVVLCREVFRDIE